MNQKKEKYVKICPKCKSTDIAFEKSTMQALGQLPNRYICSNCGYGGYQAVEIAASKLAKLRKTAEAMQTAVDKHELVDTSYGHFEVRVMWKLFAPFLIIAGIFFLIRGWAFGAVIAIIAGLFMFNIAYFKKRKLRD